MSDRRIIPRPIAERLGGPGPSSPAERDTFATVPKRRRVGVSIACELCRHKKIRCDGGRPVCRACQGGHIPCVYRSARPLSDDTIQLISDLIKLIHGITEQERARILAILEVETDADTIFALVQDGLTNQQPSTTDGVPPLPPQDAQPFGTAHVAYPTAYPILGKIESESGASRAAIRQLIRSTPGERADQIQKSIQADGHANLDGPSEDKPSPVGHPLCDSRLHNLDISLWTNVGIEDEHAARSISLYLETDHPLLGHFDPELFVSDLVGYRKDFCSSMMVNAMLYWTCQMYTTVDKDIAGYVDQFRAEAEQLWTTERSNDSILNLAAAQFMSLSYVGQGKDHATLRYYNDAAAMSARMRLFPVDGQWDGTHLRLLSSSGRIAYCYAAWGVFNWQVFMSLVYHQPGMEYPPSAPELPIPQRYPDAMAEQEELPNAKLPFDEPLEFSLPGYMGQTFAHVCRFWESIQELPRMYYDRTNGTLKEVPLYFAEYKFRQLLAWSNRLPIHLSRGTQNPHHVVVLHTWLHAVILDVFRPFLADPHLADQRLKTFDSSATTPRAVYLSSVKQLRRLVAVYRLKYSAANYSILWHPALIYVANAVLNNKSANPGWLFDFLLCVRGYQDMRASWRVADSITVALLSLAMHNRGLSSTTARDIVHDMRENQTDIPGKDDIRATFMGDLYTALSRPEVSSIEHLAELFDDNALASDYTTLFDLDHTDGAADMLDSVMSREE